LFPIALISLVLSAGRSPAQVLDTAKPERPESRAIQRQLHSRSTLDRVDAARKLAEFPPLEGARLAVQVGLTDREADVRRVAYETLLGRKDDAQVGDFLLKNIKRDATPKRNSVPTVVPVLAVLLASDLPDTQERLRKFLETWLATSKEGALIVGAVADELGLRGDVQSFATLKKLTGQKCFADSFACRRAVVRAMIGFRTSDSVEALLALLPKIDGEVRGDVVRHLEEISHEHFDYDAQAWRAWWKKHSEGFKFPEHTVATIGNVAIPQGGSSYYGLPLYGRRVVFVIDISGSMAGPRLAMAKRELTSVVSGLPEDASLGLVAFNTQVWPWRKELAVATRANKQDAARFVHQLSARGRTAPYDALEVAFHYDAEAIYLLSDGDPNLGKIVDPAGIITAISGANRGRRLSIYTIGIAPGAAEGANELFMKTLAEQNFGLHKRVDE
jgi:hypothetical protein